MGEPSNLAELHAWAISKATALLNRSAQVRSDIVLSELDAARKGFEAAVRSMEAALTTPIQPSDEIRAFVEQFTAHVGLDPLRTQLQESRAQLQESNIANHRLKETLQQTQAELATARSELERERARTAEITRDAQARLTTARGELEVKHARAVESLKEAHAKLVAARDEVNAERARADAVRADATRMRAEFESTLTELRREHATVLSEQAIGYTSQPLDELLTVFHALEEATTGSDVLTVLVNGIAREFSRVALFDVHGGGLRGTQQVGFDFQSDISKVTIPLSADSLVTRAVKTGKLEGFFAGPRTDPGAIIPFGGTPACAVAIPIVVQRATVAVIYADDSGDDGADLSPRMAQARAKVAELLHQHALLVLLRLWVEQTPAASEFRPPAKAERRAAAPRTEPKTPSKAVRKSDTEQIDTDLRQYAMRLADELEKSYKADAEVGRNRVHCQQRLREQLERSRRLYAQRISRDDPAAATLFDQYLAAIARARTETSFGRDLAVLLPA